MLNKTRYSLRTAVLVPFCFILFITILAIVLIQRASYENTLEKMSENQLNALVKSIDTRLTDFIDSPFKMNLLLKDSIVYTQANFYQKENQFDQPVIQNYLKNSFNKIKEQYPQVTAINFGTENGNYMGFKKNLDGSTGLILKSEQTNNILTVFAGDSIASREIIKLPDYMPTRRPWYQPAKRLRTSSWSDVYTNQGESNDAIISVFSPILINHKFLGTVASDIRLKAFNQFLVNQEKQTQASIMIFDNDDGRVIAQSKTVNTQSPNIEELNIKDISDLTVKEMLKHALKLNNKDANKAVTFSFEDDGKRYFSLIRPYGNTTYNGNTNNNHWSIVIALPESAIFTGIDTQQNNALWLAILFALVAGAVIFISLTRITRPIRATAEAARKISQGQWDVVIPHHGNIYETHSMIDSFNHMASSLKRSFETLRKQITYDSLTRLYTRQGFIDAVKKIRVKNTKESTFILCAVERFRDINDSIGHFRADKVLILVAERIKSSLSNKAVIARINGDEFAIYIPEPEQEQEVTQIINSINRNFSNPVKIGSEQVLINIIIGVCSTEKGNTIDQWMHNTSIALNHAKSDPSRVVHFETDMALDSFNRTQTIVNITHALESKEFIPYYQPIIDLKTNKTIGAEALARWISPEKGLISPFEFIPIAEEYGQISAIGQQILHRACLDTRISIDIERWPSDFQLHVNVSVHQLSLPNFHQVVTDILKDTQLPSQNLTLEITESHIIEDDPILLSNMNALREAGVKIAIDDFGTGYSSLAYVHKLPFDCLKVDRCFINDLSEESLKSSVISSILLMTANLDVNIVAEGVETKEQAKFITQLGCDQAQGFYYSEPLPIEEWPTELKEIAIKVEA